MTGSVILFGLGGLAVVLAALAFGRPNKQAVAIIAVSGLLGLLGYAYVGKPALPDQPIEGRIAELAAIDPADYTPAQRLARLQALTQERPDEPQPHYFIGQIMAAQARPDEAALAYQAALRRDPEFVPALVALADVLMERGGGNISPQAQNLYSRAYQLDNTQSMAGIFAGLGAYQMGETDKALRAWAIVRTTLGDDEDTQRRMLDALEARAQSETAE